MEGWPVWVLYSDKILICVTLKEVYMIISNRLCVLFSVWVEILVCKNLDF